MIRFLFKLGIILCLLFIILSFFLPARGRQAGSSAGESSGLFATVAAVGALLHDMDSFCERNPQSCKTGKSFFGLMGEKAQQGAAFAYQWLGTSLSKGAENTEQHLTRQETTQKAGGTTDNPSAKTSENLPVHGEYNSEQREKTADEIAAGLAAEITAESACPHKTAKPQTRQAADRGRKDRKQEPGRAANVPVPSEKRR